MFLLKILALKIVALLSYKTKYIALKEGVPKAIYLDNLFLYFNKEIYLKYNIKLFV